MKKFDWFDMFLFMAMPVFFAFFVGAVFGAGTGIDGRRRVLDHACFSACERLDSEMLSVQGNVCFCKNLTAMSGDYGQLFLKGE